MSELVSAPAGELVLLRKLKRLAPDFHRHLAAAQVRGQVLAAGDRVLVYEVASTAPPGRVLVTERTVIEFC